MKAGTKSILAMIGFDLLYMVVGAIIFALLGYPSIGVAIGLLVATFFPPKIVKRLREEAKAESKKDE